MSLFLFRYCGILGFVKGFVWPNHNNSTFLLTGKVTSFVIDRGLSGKVGLCCSNTENFYRS